MTKKLYVGNISFKATEDDIRGLFAGSGSVESVHLVTDPHTGLLKGFGFVEMSTEAEAQKAIETLNGTSLLDRPLVVNEAKPPRQKEQRGFGGGGRGFGRDDRSGRGRR